MPQFPFDLEDLPFFLSVARHGQLSRAAYGLKVSHVTVARHIDRLELRLKLRLFDRGPKGYVLTEQGSKLRDFAEKIEIEMLTLPLHLDGAVADLSGTIRINMPEGLANLFTHYLLPDFHRKFPALRFEIVAVQQLLNYSPSATDITVTIDPIRAEQFITEKISDYSLHVYGSIDYLNAHNVINHREDFLNHTFIGYIEGLVFMPGLDYLFEVAPKLHPKLQFSSIFSQYRAVTHGLGLAVLPDFLAKNDPRLRRVLSQQVSLSRGYWLNYRADLRHSKREQMVIDELMEAIRRINDKLWLPRIAL